MTWDDGGWDEPVASTTEYAKPQALDGHLVIIWPLGYVPHIQTKFTVPGKPSDAIQVDVVDLDAVGEDGQPGKLYRANNWMQSKLIRDLKPKIGKRLLGRIGKGQAANGMSPPWEVMSMVGDPDAIKRAEAWMEAHSDFRPTEFVVKEPWEERRPQTTQHTPEYRPQPDWSREPSPQWEDRNQWAEQPAPQRQAPVSAPVQGSADISPEELSMLQKMRQKREEDASRQAHADRLYPERQQYGY